GGWRSPLAARAVNGAPSPQHRLAERRPAAQTGEAAAAVDLQLLLVAAAGVPEVAVVVEAGAAVGDRLVEHGRNGREEPGALRPGQAVAASRRSHPGVMA